MTDKEYIEKLKKDDLLFSDYIKILDNILDRTDRYYYDITEEEINAIKRKLKSGYWR